MLSFGDLIQDLDEQRFVGRQRELNVFLESFAGQAATALHVSWLARIRKSTLVRGSGQLCMWLREG
jgi:hypothetical protein